MDPPALFFHIVGEGMNRADEYVANRLLKKRIRHETNVLDFNDET